MKALDEVLKQMIQTSGTVWSSTISGTAQLSEARVNAAKETILNGIKAAGELSIDTANPAYATLYARASQITNLLQGAEGGRVRDDQAITFTTGVDEDLKKMDPNTRANYIMLLNGQIRDMAGASAGIDLGTIANQARKAGGTVATAGGALDDPAVRVQNALADGQYYRQSRENQVAIAKQETDRLRAETREPGGPQGGKLFDPTIDAFVKNLDRLSKQLGLAYNLVTGQGEGQTPQLRGDVKRQIARLERKQSDIDFLSAQDPIETSREAYSRLRGMRPYQRYLSSRVEQGIPGGEAVAARQAAKGLRQAVREGGTMPSVARIAGEQRVPEPAPGAAPGAAPEPIPGREAPQSVPLGAAVPQTPPTPVQPAPGGAAPEEEVASVIKPGSPQDMTRRGQRRVLELLGWEEPQPERSTRA
jgi:hypothetical protein